MIGVLVMSLLLLFGGSIGGVGPGSGQTSTGARVQIWAYLGSAWAELTRDVLVDSLSLQYGLTGNRPSDSLASSGELRFALNNSATNSAHTLGYYSAFHASKRAGWNPGVETFLWLEGAVATKPVSTMTRSGSTVTVTTSVAHGLITGYTVRIAGAAQTDYNWFWVVTVLNSTQFTFQVSSMPTTPATGTITVTRGLIRFWGRVDTIDAVPGTKGARRSEVVAYDRMRDLIDADLYNVAIQINQTESQIFQSMFGSLDASIAPRALVLDTGIDQIPYALDDIGDGVKCASVLADLTRSSYGLGFVYQYGIFRYISRNTRATATSVATISSTMSGFVAAGSISKAYNLVRVTTHPRHVDPTDVVLYAASGTPPYIPANGSVTVGGAFRSPDDATRLIGAASTVALSPGTDYAANSQADGQGLELTSSLSVSPSVKASRVEFTIADTSATPAYTVDGAGNTFLQIRGRGLYDNAPRTFFKSSVQGYGVRVSNNDLPYQNVDATGQMIADFIHDQYSTLGTQVDSVTLKASPTSNPTLYTYLSLLDLGDVVTLSEIVTGVSSVNAMILGVQMRWLTKTAIECTWLLGPKITLSPPSTPTSVSAATNLTDGDVRVTWATATAGSYTQVYVDGIYRGTAAIGATSFDINNLTRATNYSVTVRHMFFGMPSAFSSPVTARPHIEATGGTVTTPGDGYKYHHFTSNGTFTVTSPGRYDIELIAGGGAGNLTYAPGNIYGGGGGGAGGRILLLDEQEPAGTYPIVIGAGALYNTGDLTVDLTGGDSTYRTHTALGGGRGGSNNNGSPFGGHPGGSGGGGGAAGGAGNTGTAGQGNSGGNASNDGGNETGGSGGGFSAAGTTGGATTGPAGGAGVVSLDGVTRCRGGDGGGITVTTLGAGANNTGNGGSGGQNGTASGAGYNGGSGICIIRYPI